MDTDTAGGAILTEDAGRPCLVLHGALHIGGVRDLHEVALEVVARDDDATVSCLHVEWIDAAALQCLLALDEALRARGHRLRFEDVPPALADLLDRAGVATRWLATA